MRGLYRRGNVYWVDYRANGKRYRESTNTTKRREADYILACRKKEAKEGKIPEIKQIKNHSFRELSEAYLNWTKPQKAYKDKARRVKQLREVFGNYDLRDFTTRLIEEYQAKRLEYNKPATVNRMLTILKHMFRKAVDWDMLEEDVRKRIRKIKLTPEHNTRLRYLSIEECQTLIECCASHLKPIVTVALHTGMRKSEILSLKWEQIDLKHGFILLEITKNGERREIPINTTLEEMFNEIPHSVESVYVFTDRNGNPYKEVKRSFSTALKKTGIRDFRFHDLRHTFASHLVMNGVDITSIKELLGHKTLTMTMRYAHLSPGHKRKAVDTLDKMLRSNQDENFGHNLVTILQPEKEDVSLSRYKISTPERIRTSDLRFRKPLLYPSELRAHKDLWMQNRGLAQIVK